MSQGHSALSEPALPDAVVTHDAVIDEQEPADDAGVPARGWGAALLLTGVIGLVASFVLTVEKIELLEDPNYRPSCSINPILSCGSVMKTWQASVFGFPNMLLGLIGFTLVATSGVLVLARVRLPRWYWAGFLLGTVAGAALVHWLIYQSLYKINALCPYCMVVWSVTMPTLAIAIGLAIPVRTSIGRTWLSFRWSLLGLWFLAVITMIYLRFDYYWNTLF